MVAEHGSSSIVSCIAIPEIVRGSLRTSSGSSADRMVVSAEVTNEDDLPTMNRNKNKKGMDQPKKEKQHNRKTKTITEAEKEAEPITENYEST